MTKTSKRLHVRTSLVVLGLALGALLTHSAAADAPSDLKRFAGNYVYAQSTSHGEQVVEKALEGALAELNVAKRMLAMAAMKRRSLLIKSVRIVAGDTVKVRLDEFDAEAKLDTPKTIKNPQGKEVKLLFRFKGGKLEQIMKSDRGSMSTVYKLDADGKTLHRFVTIKGKKLTKPIRFKLTYKRT